MGRPTSPNSRLSGCRPLAPLAARLAISALAPEPALRLTPR